MRKIGLFVLIIAAVAMAAPAMTSAREGNDVYQEQWSTDDWDAEPTTGGSHDGWGEYFITTFENTTGFDVTLLELGMPCCGPASDPDYGWVVWEDVGGMSAPSGGPTTADYYGSYTPVDSADDTFPPVTYTYVDLSAEGIVIPAGNFFSIGYDVTGNGGQIDFNGFDTWAWYYGAWDSDQSWGRTALIQVEGEYDDGAAVVDVSWGEVKNLD